MGNITRFSAINTKIKALKGRLLTDKDFEIILSKETIQDVALYLKQNTKYNRVLENNDINKIYISDLELLLKKYIVLKYEKIIHYFTNEYRKLFKIIFLRHEIEDIKLYIRALIRGEDLSKAKNLILYSGVYSTVNHNKLAQSKSIKEFIENLKGTLYYRELKNIINEQSEIMFSIEMNLDRFYFRILFEHIDKLSGQDKKLLNELLGKNIDLLNIQFIYRGLKFYNMSPTELLNYTLIGGYKYTYKDLKEICYSNNLEQFINKFSNSGYKFLFSNNKTINIFMERRIERYMYDLLLYFNKREKMNIIESITYLHLLEYEVRDLISIIEAKRYGLNIYEIMKYLVRSKGVKFDVRSENDNDEYRRA